MNTIVALSNSQVQTMSSREISELTGKQHKHVIRDIRAMLDELEKDGQVLGHVREDKDARGYTAMFHLDRELTDTLLTGYSIPLRAKVIKRWHELEVKQIKPTIPQTYAQALLEAGRLALELELKEKELEVAKPKVEFVNKFVERGTNRNVTSVAKELGVTAIKLGKWLRAKGYMNKATDKQVWNKEFIDKGYGVQKLFNVEVQDEEFKSGSQALITPAGDVFIKETIAKYGFTVEV